jgi:hypothetical protein
MRFSLVRLARKGLVQVAPCRNNNSLNMEGHSMEANSTEGNNTEDSSMEDNHTDPALAPHTLESWFNRHSKPKDALQCLHLLTLDTITHTKLRYPYPTLFPLRLLQLCHQRRGGTVSNLFYYHLARDQCGGGNNKRSRAGHPSTHLEYRSFSFSLRR